MKLLSLFLSHHRTHKTFASDKRGTTTLLVALTSNIVNQGKWPRRIFSMFLSFGL